MHLFLPLSLFLSHILSVSLNVFLPLYARSPLSCCKCVAHAGDATTATALEFSSILFCAKSLWGGTTGAAADADATATAEPLATAATTSEFHLGLF